MAIKKLEENDFLPNYDIVQHQNLTVTNSFDKWSNILLLERWT